MRTIEEIETRLSEIKTELETEGADLDALTEETRKLLEEKENLRADAEKAEEIRKAVSEGKGDVVEERKEDHTMTLKEIRSSQEYIDAFARYVKTGRDEECRSLLTVNAPSSGSLPVPEFLQEMIETAWERDEILSRTRKTFIRGNLKVPFEKTADPAYQHPEGSTAPTEEALTFGLVTLKPMTIKKWVSFSTEVEALRGEIFLRYVYDELIYRVTKKLSDDAVGDITSANATHQATSIGVPQVTMAPGVTTIPTAVANLGPDARNLVIIMNRLTEVNFIEAYAAGNFAVDPFAGIPRIYTSALPAYTTATGGTDVYAIVGDLNGLQVNYPEGDGVATIYDNLTKKTLDIVEILARQYAAHGITKLGHFVNLIKPAAATT